MHGKEEEYVEEAVEYYSLASKGIHILLPAIKYKIFDMSSSYHNN